MVSRQSRTLRPTRRELLAGGVSAGLAAGLCGSLSSCGRKLHTPITGGFAEEGETVGHRMRDGALPAATGDARRAGIAIVGGGVAGLAAAWRLARAGVEDVRVFDLGSTLGGTSRSGRANGLAFPWGAHYLPVPRATQRALVAFLTEAGIVAREEGGVRAPATTLVRAPQERICGLGFWEEGLWLNAGASAEDEDDLERFEALVREVVRADARGRRLFDLPLARSSRELAELDARSASSWADENGLTAERIRWYLEYATRDDFGASLDGTSAWALLHYFASRADLDTGETPEFMTWPEGNARLVVALRQTLVGEIESGAIATAIRPGESGVEVDVYSHERDTSRTWLAEHVILATPQFVNARILAEDPERSARATFDYGPWVVANLHLERPPTSRGFPRSWDNVIHGSPSLGYVDATHQLDRMDRSDAVWTWYFPLVNPDSRAARVELQALPWEHWRDVVLDDLRLAHPDIDECVQRIDVWRWGHAMVRPVPGFLWGDARERAARPVGAVHFAHSDLSGMALFEEAHWQGVRAAEEVLRARGVDFESLLVSERRDSVTTGLRPGWILGAKADAAIFWGPLVFAVGLIAWAAQRGVLHDDLPPWAFALLIIGVDVAHVYSTAFRVYFDREELLRRPSLYLGVPMLCFAGGVALHVESPALFWRVLAYLAVFHFVRQQWGWMAYSRRQAGEASLLDRRLDQIAIYNATVFPLLWWHANLPREFTWFLEGDFATLPTWIGTVGLALHWMINAVYLGRQAWRYATGAGVNLAKLQIWLTTWLVWYGGIVALNSDLAFTATNVLAHGVPYLAVVWRIERERWSGSSGTLARLFRPRRAWLFLALLGLAGYLEEWGWDKLVWHEHGGLFPGGVVGLGPIALSLVVPLLAVPQATHYVLDGWIWKTRNYSDVRRLFGRSVHRGDSGPRAVEPPVDAPA